jgi:outer membrane biosynthesis protein TonB
MRIRVTHASWLVALLALLPVMQGCDQKAKATQTQTLAPPIVDAPPSKPATVSTADLPPPEVGTPQPSQPATTDPNAKPAAQPKKPSHKKTATPQQPTQDAANPAPSVSAIGELSGGASGDQRSQTEEMIKATEKGVNSINRKLSDAETKTAAQIHEFLKQAREALTSGDVDGAATLAKKAKVLLAELNNQ